MNRKDLEKQQILFLFQAVEHLNELWSSSASTVPLAERA